MSTLDQLENKSNLTALELCVLWVAEDDREIADNAANELAEIKQPETPRVFPVDFLKEPGVRYIMSDVKTLSRKRKSQCRHVPVVLIREHGV